MTYEQALAIIQNQVRLGKDPALDRIKKLLEKLGNPQDGLRFVHVGGTNGKGTTCTLIASALRQTEQKVGLYTSPYVIDFRERFQINGAMIGEEELAEIVSRVAPITEKMSRNGETIGQFEFITAVAFLWFLEQDCDIVLLEVGIGGRFDATNVILCPEAAVITSISKDHMDMLGETIAEIAFEKAGIIKPGGDLVVYPVQEEDALAILQTICQERAANLILPKLSDLQIMHEDIHGSRFVYKGAELCTPFTGRHQVYNAITAYEALRLLGPKGFPLKTEQIREGFSRAFIPARMEVLADQPLILLDGGHNAGFAAALREVILQLPDTPRTAVFGMMADKDSHEVLEILAPLFDRMIMTAPKMPRAETPENLAKELAKYGKPAQHVITAGSQEEALALAWQARKEGSALIFCGSFYLASEFRQPILARLAEESDAK